MLFPLQRDRLRVHSREHSMRSDASIQLKRDDELSCGISGSKLRKLLFIVNKLKLQNKTRCYVECGYNSNNALASAQILIENGIEAIFIINKQTKQLSVGNGGYFSLFSPKIIYEKPECIESEAEYLPEGCLTINGILGAASLLFDHVIHGKNTQVLHIDSGSGASAIAAILAASLLQLDLHIVVHSACDTHQEFQSKLSRFKTPFFTFFGYSGDTTSVSYSYNHFVCGKSFGSFPSTIKKTIHFFAQCEGVIFDPLYGAKLLHGLALDPTFAMHCEYVSHLQSPSVEKNKIAAGNSCLAHSRVACDAKQRTSIDTAASQSDKLPQTREVFQLDGSQSSAFAVGQKGTCPHHSQRSHRSQSSLIVHGGGILSLSGFFPL